LSVPEIIAVIMAIGYLLLAIRENIWCWACAGVSTAIYVWLFIDARLYMESALNAFYFAMAVYGWYVWQAGRRDGHEKAVVVWPLRSHAIAIGAIVAGSAVSGYVLDRRLGVHLLDA
jgi:nicotinamide mononucleotide transporter